MITQLQKTPPQSAVQEKIVTKVIEPTEKIVALQQENHRLREENRQLREEFDLYKKNSAAELANAYKRASELESENHALRNRKQSMTLRQATDD